MINAADIQEKFFRLDEKLEKNKVLMSVRGGLTLMIPLLLIGSFALILISLPIPGYQDFMASLFGSHWKNIFVYIRDGTFGILSVIMVLCISYSYANEYSAEGYRDKTNPLITAIVSLGSFTALLGLTSEGFSVSRLGVTSLFFAIVVAVLASKLFVKLSSYPALQIKAFTDGANSNFNAAITAIYPAAITILVFAAFNQVITSVFGIPDLQGFISDCLNTIFLKLGSSAGGAFLFVFLIHLFWFFGLHGSNILEPVAQSIYVPALTVNIEMIGRHQAPTEIFTKTFFDTFVLMGGCGSSLCLILAILISAKHKNLRRHAKMSLLPVFFNINELIIFGIPIVLNPVFLIPFIGVPMLLTLTSYLAVLLGLVPHTNTLVEWTTPIFLSGYTATQSFSGCILQLVNVVLGILCYIPFVKVAQRKTAVRTSSNMKRVYEVLNQDEKHGVDSFLITRQDQIGHTARSLVADLEHDLQNGKLELYYQPQINYDGSIYGVEALLRWKHDIYGFIYPPLIIALAKEAHLTEKLGCWIMDTACRDLKELDGCGDHDMTFSVNVSAHQLENDRFVQQLEDTLVRHKVEPSRLEIEITEQTALSGTKKILAQMTEIKKLGVKFAMDDFGMGHSSLMYLKEYEFDTIKIDGSLVREILTNNTCGDIISSIVFLSKSMYFSIIAEYVETEEQRDELHRLGCDRYQGYLYSPAVPKARLKEYLEEKQPVNK